ncbi:MAG: phosphatase PAP2 family protein, partial [Burkholderiales bacterium]|nr:phosphatase PAP2 family protein [Burkholderiales bacterium]
MLLSADIAAQFGAVPDTATFLPGDHATVSVLVQNVGDEAPADSLRIDLYASADAVFDAGDSKLASSSIDPARLLPNADPDAVPMDVDFGSNLPPGSYRWIALLDSDNRVAESNEANNQVIAADAFQFAWQFGSVPGRADSQALTLTDADGSTVIFALSGAGLGEVAPGADDFDLALSGTDADSVVSVSVAGGDARTRLHQIQVAGSLGSLLAPQADLSGDVDIGGALGHLALNDITAAQTIRIGASDAGAAAIVAAHVADLVLQSDSPIDLLSIADWTDADGVPDLLSAPSLQRLVVEGDFAPDLHLTGDAAAPLALVSARIGGAITGGSWNVQGRAGQIAAGSIDDAWRASFIDPVSSLVTRGDLGGELTAPALGVLQAGGNLVNASIMIGGNLGADGRFGGAGADADSFSAGNLPRLRIGGSMLDSRVWVGIDPVDGIFDNGNDRLAAPGRGQMREIGIGGAIDASSHIAAHALPAMIRLDRQSVGSSAVPQLRAVPSDLVAPTIAVALAQDSGAAPDDAVTNQYAVSGTVADFSAITAFEAAFDSEDAGAFADVTSALQPGGEFVLDEALLDNVAGGALADGAHTLYLTATDAAGNRSALAVLAFVLDTVAPAAPAFSLARTSDSGIAGDDTTAAARVNLTGAAEAGTVLTLLPGGAQTLAALDGSFQFADVVLAEGANALTVQAADLAGNRSSFERTLLREGEVAADAVLFWNQQALEAVRRAVSDPTFATRMLAMVSIAQYDTIAAIEGMPAYMVKAIPAATVDADAALAQAAYTVLAAVYPSQRPELDAALSDRLSAIGAGDAKSGGLALGETVAQAVLALRADDGANAFVDYPGSTATGKWRPTAPMFEVAKAPQWGMVTPFALSSPNEFRADAPPALDSAAYAASVEEIRALGAATSTTRTAEQSEIAQFWADGKGSYTPPGHWNVIAHEVALAEGNSLTANARLFAQLNVALADTAIATWDTKYTYGLWRPLDAIAHADADGNAATIQQPGWTPLLITPSHPEYVSGHSAFSAAAATVLAATFGDAHAFSTASATLPGVARSFTSFTQAADEAGRSRVYGGIHYEFTDQAGKVLGGEVAHAVLERFALAQDLEAPHIATAALPSVSSGDVSLGGQILDNLSGVASAQFRIDDASPAALPFDAEGRFSLATAFVLDGSDDGAHTITIVALDAAGNRAERALSFVLDTRAPAIDLATLAEGASIDGASLLSGTADPTGSTLVALSYALDDAAALSLTFDPGTGVFDAPLVLGGLPPGEHTLTLRALDAAGNAAALAREVVLAQAAPFAIAEFTPSSGASDVGVTFRPQIVFTRPADVATLTADAIYATGPDGVTLAASVVPALDGMYARLLFAQPMPGDASVTLHVDGALIKAASDALALDADGDGNPGGALASAFGTVSRSGIAGTRLIGKVVDPGPDLEPMTFDDIRRGADGIIHTPDDVFLLPIAHAKVFILGQEASFVFTDAEGNFALDNVPVGNVKIVVDGKTASNAPAGVFFPEMAMDADLRPGIDNTVMGSMGGNEERVYNAARGEVYLPRIPDSAMHAVSATGPTVITVDAQGAPDLSEAQRAFLSLTVQPGSAIGENAQPLENVEVGIATVPPELVRDMLPPGLLQHTFDITIQARDTSGNAVAVFAQPAKITFPNVFNAAPGTKLNILSFDHTTGRLVINGTGTVSADGKSVTSDEGSGIMAPGWHGVTPEGVWAKVKFYGKAFRDIGLASLDVARQFTATWLAGVAADIDLANNLIGTFGKVGRPIGKLLRVGAPIEKVLNDIAEKGWLFPGLALDVIAQGLNGLSEFIATGKVTVSIPEVATWALSQPLLGHGRSPGTEIANFGQLLFNGAQNYVTLRERAQGFANSVHALGNTWQAYFGAQGVDLEPSSAQLQGATNRLLQSSESTEKLLRNLGDATQILAPLQVGSIIPPQDVARLQQAQQGATEALNELASAPGDTLFEVYYNHTREIGAAWDSMQAALAPLPDAPVATSFYSVVPSTSDLPPEPSVRGVTDAAGGVSVLLPPNAVVQFSGYDPSSDAIATTIITTGVSGTRPSATPVFVPDVSADADGDGLSDLAEGVIGTRPGNSDSDGDGISDHAEVIAGTNPLDGRPAATGVIASLALQGSARAITAGQAIATDTPVLAVATGDFGLAFIDATRSDRLVTLREVDLPGISTDVAFDGALGYAAVASNAGGLNLIDIAGNVRTIALDTAAVEIIEGIVYANNGSALRSYDLLTGEFLQSLPLGASPIVAMARAGAMLYTVDANRMLRAVDTGTGTMVARGSLLLPAAATRLFVADGVAYVASEGAFLGGYETADVSDADNLALVSGVDSTAIAAKAIALNGSGLAVSVGSPANIGNIVQVLDASDPATTDRLLAQYALPADPFDVAIIGGLAYVASGDAGVAVVNYRAYDDQGIAPVVTASVAALDLDPVDPGIQILEGSILPIAISVSDDVQVRSVDALIGGRPVAGDLSFPFDLAVALPTLAANGASALTMQVRATDTGGNIGLAAPIEIDLVPDRFAPSLIASNVADGSSKGRTFRAVTLTFSEPMATASLSASTIELIAPDDSVIAPLNIQFRQQGREVQLTYDTLPQLGDYQLRLLAASITDRPGNALGNSDQIIRFTVTRYSNEWIAPAGGFWDDPANWSTGSVPVETDDVYIGLAATETVTFRDGAATVASLVSEAGFTMTGGTLTLLGDSELRASFQLKGGTLAGTGTLTLTGTGSQWSGGLMTGGGTTRIAAGADLTITGGNRKYLAERTIRNEGLLIDANADFVELNGAAVLDNAGVFDIRSDASWQHFSGPGGSLTIDNSGTLQKTAGSGQFYFDDTTLANTGTVDAQSGTLAFGGAGRPDGVSTGEFLAGSGATLRFFGGTQRLQAGAAMSGAGRVQVSGGLLDLDA